MNAIEGNDRFLAAHFPVDVLSNPLTALVYEESFDIGKIFAAIAERARDAGIRLGGVMEKPSPEPAPPGRRCDMYLQDLTTGQTIKISEERGALARGCRLDHDGLARTCAQVLSSVPNCDVILLNKFGKTEAEGGGFRCIISDALALEVPVVIGVPRRNLAAWRDYAGDFAFEIDALTLSVALEAA
jgi:nucleoside-triphosphatase THEP1